MIGYCRTSASLQGSEMPAVPFLIGKFFSNCLILLLWHTGCKNERKTLSQSESKKYFRLAGLCLNGTHKLRVRKKQCRNGVNYEF
jgi:hypothetical protein